MFVTLLAAAVEHTPLRLVADLNPGPDFSTPTGFFVWNDHVWFKACSEHAGKGVMSLYCTDGSTAGTRRIKDFPLQERGSIFDNPFVFEKRLYFQGPNAGLGKGSRVWVTDGTEAGTRPISEDGKDVCDEARPFLIGDRLVLFVHGNHGRKHDLVALNLHTGVEEAIAVPFDGWDDYTDGAMLNGVLLKLDFNGKAFWGIDGTRSGLKKLELQGVPTFKNDDGINQFVSLPNGVLMLPNGQLKLPLELWHTDGKSVVKMASCWSDNHVSQLWFGRVRDLGVILTYNRTRRCGLWSSDGTVQGSRLLLDLDPYNDATFSFSSERMPTPVVAGGRLFFVMDDGKHGLELWCSDGTQGGTHLVIDMVLGSEDSGIRRLYPAPNGQILMECRSENRERTIWISDGSEAGTRQLAALGETSFSELTVFKNMLLMQSRTGEVGDELWALDLPETALKSVTADGAKSEVK